MPWGLSLKHSWKWDIRRFGEWNQLCDGKFDLLSNDYYVSFSPDVLNLSADPTIAVGFDLDQFEIVSRNTLRMRYLLTISIRAGSMYQEVTTRVN